MRRAPLWTDNSRMASDSRKKERLKTSRPMCQHGEYRRYFTRLRSASARRAGTSIVRRNNDGLLAHRLQQLFDAMQQAPK